MSSLRVWACHGQMSLTRAVESEKLASGKWALRCWSQRASALLQSSHRLRPGCLLPGMLSILGTCPQRLLGGREGSSSAPHLPHQTPSTQPPLTFYTQNHVQQEPTHPEGQFGGDTLLAFIASALPRAPRWSLPWYPASPSPYQSSVVLSPSWHPPPHHWPLVFMFVFSTPLRMGSKNPSSQWSWSCQPPSNHGVGMWPMSGQLKAPSSGNSDGFSVAQM